MRPVPLEGHRMVSSRGPAFAERRRVNGVSVGRQRELVSDAAVDGALLHRQPTFKTLCKAIAGARTSVDGLRSDFRAADATASPSVESSGAVDPGLAGRRVRSGSDTAF